MALTFRHGGHFKGCIFALFSLKIASYFTDCYQTLYLGVVRIAEAEMTLIDFDLGKWQPF